MPTLAGILEEQRQIEKALEDRKAQVRHAFLVCDQGGLHTWSYDRSRGYTCQKCGVVVTKAELKRYTD